MKWKNYGLWVSLASILYMVFRDLGVQIDLTTWETYVTAVLGILAALGIISNPEKGKGFFDKIPKSPNEAITQVAQHIENQSQQNQQTGSNQQNVNPSIQNQQVQQQPFPQQNIEQPPQNQSLDFNQNNTSQSSAPQSQAVEPTSVPSEMYDESQSTQIQQDSESTEQTALDRDSVHGMPPPPYERN